jgi:hypothetical protein
MSAAPAPSSAASRAGNLSKFDCCWLLEHASVQMTERYLGTEQDLSVAVNDGSGLEMD